jgi:hypothetical protein
VVKALRWLMVASLGLVGCGDDGGSGPTPDPDPLPVGECGAVTTFEDGKTASTEIHVDDGGSDDSGDGSEGAPYATLEAAAAQASPGTAIIVHEGNYTGGLYIANLQGSADAPIWIGGAPGESRPVLSGGDFVVQFSGGRYLVIHDLELTGGSAGGINFDDMGEYADETVAQHLVMRDLYIHDVGSTGNQDCLKLSGLDDFFVLDGQFDDCGDGGSGIDMVGCHRGVLARNRLTSRSSSGIQAKGGSSDLLILANRITDAGQRALNLGGSTGFEFFRPPLSSGSANAEATNLIAAANVIVGSVSPVAFVGCDGCKALNNTLIDPENWTVRILQETTDADGYSFVPTRNGVFSNNLVVFQRGQLSTDVNVGGDTEPDSFTFANNLWFASDDAGGSSPNLPVTETGGVIGQDPSLDGEYRPTSGSPAIGAGQAQSEVPGDADGECYGDPPTIGAFVAP